MSLPTVLVSSVIRSTHQGESHGGLYLVDLQSHKVEQVLDWDDPGISWEGRGLDRGLRGIAFAANEIYVAASDEIFVYDREFKPRESFKNRYLKHCHEISLAGSSLLLTSTGFDSILVFDLESGVFVTGYQLTASRRPTPKGAFMVARGQKSWVRVKAFNPESEEGPEPRDTLHINNVTGDAGKPFASGTGIESILQVEANRLRRYARIPAGTHNARPFGVGSLYNHTAEEAICLADRSGRVTRRFEIHLYPEEELLNADLPRDHARQGFGRGLCVHEDLVIGGSSPATVTAYRLDTGESVSSVNLTMDVRNAVHGLEVWPY